MKTLFITLSILFAAVAGTVYAANDNTAANEKDVNVSEVRKVEAFSSVKVTSVATVYFTQSDNYSLKIEGKEDYVTTTTTEVTNDCLIIGFKKGSDKNRKKSVKIWLTAPDLKSVHFTGVGSFNCKEPLKLNDVKFEIEGVGEVDVEDLTCNTLVVQMEGVGGADIHVNCNRLDARMEGVGSVKLSGKARQTNISKDGIGGVNTRNLKVGE